MCEMDLNRFCVSDRHSVLAAILHCDASPGLEMGILCTIFLTLTLPAPSFGDEKAQVNHVEALRAAWTARQKATRTFDFRWIETQTILKGSISAFEPSQDIVPNQDTVFDIPKRICVDGDKVRYEYVAKSWYGPKKQFIDDPYSCTFNGDECRMLNLPGVTDWARGVIHAKREHEDVKNVANILPIILTYRGLDTGMSKIQVGALADTGKTGVIDGVTCSIVMWSPQPGNLNELWVDPANSYALRRYIKLRDGKASTSIDISYSSNDSASLVPQQWTIALFLGTPMMRIYSSTVTDFARNTPLAGSQFETVFPEGCRVVDFKSNPRRDYIVRSGGDRIILPQDIGATYEQMLASEPGRAKEPRLFDRYKWWLAAVAGTMTIGVAYLLIRRLMKSRHLRMP